jgi:hypothetical protein
VAEETQYTYVDRTAKDLKLEVGELLVIRLWSWTKERLQKDAEDEHFKAEQTNRRLSYYSISTFAMPLGLGEEVPELTDRLVGYVRTKRTARHYCLVTEPELAAAGFQLILSGPHEHHYDVPLGEDRLDLDAVAKLADLFGTEKIKMPR